MIQELCYCYRYRYRYRYWRWCEPLAGRSWSCLIRDCSSRPSTAWPGKGPLCWRDSIMRTDSGLKPSELVDLNGIIGLPVPYRRWSSLALQDHYEDFFIGCCDILSLLAISRLLFLVLFIVKKILNKFSDFVLLMGPGRLFHPLSHNSLAEKLFRYSSLGGGRAGAAPILLFWFCAGSGLGAQTMFCHPSHLLHAVSSCELVL